MSAESQQNDRRASADETAIEEALPSIRRLIDDGIIGLGGYSVAAGVVRKDRSDLKKAVSAIDGEPTSRVLSIEDLLRIVARIRHANPALAARIAAEIVNVFDLVVFPKVTHKPEVERDILRGVIHGLGPIAVQAMADALGGSR